jgi:hypothetical protein
MRYGKDSRQTGQSNGERSSSCARGYRSRTTQLTCRGRLAEHCTAKKPKWRPGQVQRFVQPVPRHGSSLRTPLVMVEVAIKENMVDRTIDPSVEDVLLSRSHHGHWVPGSSWCIQQVVPEIPLVVVGRPSPIPHEMMNDSMSIAIKDVLLSGRDHRGRIAICGGAHLLRRLRGSIGRAAEARSRPTRARISELLGRTNHRSIVRLHCAFLPNGSRYWRWGGRRRAVR